MKRPYPRAVQDGLRTRHITTFAISAAGVPCLRAVLKEWPNRGAESFDEKIP